ncbi:phage antirepressor KilAC domain-containing protein [Aggregatibacter actinomycetemcomitans]|nr:phage antirepressor KilAC domain-containing protein [Aggregatibacter actinomycetemcomitans]
MLNELEIHSAGFSAQYKDSTGRTLRCYNLPKDLTITLIAGYNVKLRKRIIDRWQELENRQNPTALLPDFTNPAEAARAWADEVEKNQLAQQQLLEVRPTVEAYERIAVATDGAICITDAAKILQMKPKELFNWLFVHKWIYRRPGNAGWIAYQDKLQQLLLEHKIHIARREDGTEKVCEQVLITPKGLTKLAKLLNVELV